MMIVRFLVKPIHERSGEKDFALGPHETSELSHHDFRSCKVLEYVRAEDGVERGIGKRERARKIRNEIDVMGVVSGTLPIDARDAADKLTIQPVEGNGPGAHIEEIPASMGADHVFVGNGLKAGNKPRAGAQAGRIAGCPEGPFVEDELRGFPGLRIPHEPPFPRTRGHVFVTGNTARVPLTIAEDVKSRLVSLGGVWQGNAMQDVLIIGAGGNSRVIIDMIVRDGRYRVVGLLDDDPARRGETMTGVTILGSRSQLGALVRQGLRHAVVGIGCAKSTAVRRQVCRETRSAGCNIPSIVHPAAIIAGSVSMGTGLLIMAGAIVNPCVTIEDDVLINTGCIVEHDCVVEQGAFLGPGVKLAGNTRVGRYAFVGIGAVSVPGIHIGEESLVAAGAVLTRDVPARHFARGVPAVVSPLASV